MENDFQKNYITLFKVKSLYIIKNIFSYLTDKQKLSLINYNKQILKKLEIDIEFFKKISGKEIIGERNGFGVEYDINSFSLIFEGEYKKGKRNGKGKEYDKDIFTFEGEYLNGKRHGKGKEYENKQLIFEGEYLKGKRNGKGIEYFNNNKIKFEGEYLNGKRKGKRKESYFIFTYS